MGILVPPLRGFEARGLGDAQYTPCCERLAASGNRRTGGATAPYSQTPRRRQRRQRSAAPGVQLRQRTPSAITSGWSCARSSFFRWSLPARR